MITIEKLLFLINTPSLAEPKDYFLKEGFVLEQNTNENLMWVKPLKIDRAAVVSLWRMESAYKTVDYRFYEEGELADIQKDATANFGFELIEDEEATIMRTEEFQLRLKKDEHPPFISYSLKLYRRNKQREVERIEVSMSPPPGV